MNVKQKKMARIKVRASAESHSRTVLRARDVIDVSDEPIERGGTNEGMTPTELLLGALAACTNIMSQRIAKVAGIDIEGMEIEIEATLDRRTTTLSEDIELPMPEMTMRVALRADADDLQVARIAAELRKFCPVSKIIRGAGVDLIEEWTLNRP